MAELLKHVLVNYGADLSFSVSGSWHDSQRLLDDLLKEVWESSFPLLDGM